MEYLRLFIQNRRLMTFGIMLTFFSGFGKTFILALYIPNLVKSYHISPARFSMIYALATVLGGIGIIFAGKWIDKIEIKKYAFAVVLTLASSSLLLAFSHHLIWLVLAIAGIRMCGQGLMTHISVTAMSKYFTRCRGKAVSIAVMGHPVGEAILPIFAFSLIHLWSWKGALISSVVLMVIILIPLISWSFSKKPKVVISKKSRTTIVARKKSNIKWTLREIILNKKLYRIAPSMFTLSFLNTGLLFYLVPIAHEKGWTSEWITSCFIAFGIGSFIAGIMMGSLIDKYRATRLFPFYLLPYAAGILLMLTFSFKDIGFLFLLLAGLSVGMSNCMESSVIAEIYGVKSVGTARSLFVSLMIMGSALGPLCMGLLVDSGFHFVGIMKAGIIFILISSFISFRGIYKFYPLKIILNRLHYKFHI